MKHKYPELDWALEKSLLQDELYRPSSFWKNVTKEIVRLIELHGIENFRTHNTIFSYFAPTYGVPCNSFNQQIVDHITGLLQSTGNKKQQLAMQEFLSGYFHALSDYRVFSASDDNQKQPCLQSFSESDYGKPNEQFEFDGKKFSRSALNYLTGLCFLKKHISADDEIATVMEIGGGFGTLGEILFHFGDSKYINIDIPPVSFVSWSYLSHLYGESGIEPYQNTKGIIDIGALRPCTVLNTWDIETLRGNIDLFVNFISFQEMEPAIVANYLSHIKQLNPKYILLRNMREGKQKKLSEAGHGVEQPILKDDYMKMIDDTHLLIASNVIPFGYKTVDGYHSELMLFKNKRY